MKDLVSSRIVVMRKIGKTKIYKINERNPIYTELKKLLMKERTMLLDVAKEFVSSLDKKDIKVIIVFGSVARGDSTTGSDIDILFIGTTHKIKARINKSVQNFLEKYDVEIVPTYMTLEQFKGRKEKTDRFIANVIKEGMIVFGTVGD
jgi:predicted nucleotidyltransferase